MCQWNRGWPAAALMVPELLLDPYKRVHSAGDDDAAMYEVRSSLLEAYNAKVEGISDTC